MRKNVIIYLMIIIGMILILYPFISNYINEKDQTKIITKYQDDVGALTESEKEEKLRNAERYNDNLEKDIHVDVSLEEDEDEDDSSYFDMLDIGSKMGYISIPKISVELPIYHGTSDVVLKNGVGHLETSSLPVGGKNTHCVLAGHTGLASGKIFDNIDKLKEGDVFYLKVLDKTLEYKVDNIAKVDPNDTEAIKIDPEKDYVTLVTCTPRLINSHRLLVRGERVQSIIKSNNGEIVDKTEQQDQETTSKIDNIKQIIKDNKGIIDYKILMFFIGIVLILISILLLSHKFIKFDDKNKKNQMNIQPEPKQTELKHTNSNKTGKKQIEKNQTKLKQMKIKQIRDKMIEINKTNGLVSKPDIEKTNTEKPEKAKPKTAKRKTTTKIDAELEKPKTVKRRATTRIEAEIDKPKTVKRKTATKKQAELDKPKTEKPKTAKRKTVTKIESEVEAPKIEKPKTEKPKTAKRKTATKSKNEIEKPKASKTKTTKTKK